jgi:glycosyltransferase involved in cell wall biosynthesis
MLCPYVDATQSAAVGLAMGFGLPLVVTDVVASGISQENQPYIKIVKVGDVNALANAIWQVLGEAENTRPNYLAAEEAWRRMVVAIEGFA